MRPLERACFYANVCTITGPATAVADPMSRGREVLFDPREPTPVRLPRPA
jgi:hypothetical protein